MPIPFQGDDLGARPQDDHGVVFDAANEVTRHRVGQPLSANQHVDALRRLGEKHGGLPRGISAADDDDVLADAQLRLHRHRHVVHTRAFEPREGQLPPVNDGADVRGYQAFIILPLKPVSWTSLAGGCEVPSTVGGR